MGEWSDHLLEGLVERGHTEHCASRIVWGDGKCECNLAGKAVSRTVVRDVPPEPTSRTLFGRLTRYVSDIGSFVQLAHDQGTRLVDVLERAVDLYERDVRARERMVYGEPQRDEESSDASR